MRSSPSRRSSRSPTARPTRRRSRTPDREIDWSRTPEEIVNQVRALSPHIGARSRRGASPARLARSSGARGLRPRGGRRRAPRGPARRWQADDGRGIRTRTRVTRRLGRSPTRSCRRVFEEDAYADRAFRWALRVSSRATTRSRCSSRTGPCSGSDRSTTRSRRSAGAGAQARPSRARGACGSAPTSSATWVGAGARGRERVGGARARGRSRTCAWRSRTRSCGGWRGLDELLPVSGRGHASRSGAQALLSRLGGGGRGGVNGGMRTPWRSCARRTSPQSER